VIWISVPKNILQRAFSLVTPLCPSTVEPVHAFINACPWAVSEYATYPVPKSIIELASNAALKSAS
jgi:hypothetical protein